MSVSGSVTAAELVRALDRNDSTLPAEIGTFIVLEGCESMLQQGPRALADLGSVRVSEQGAISLSGAACDDETAARSLHRSLATLLLAAGPTLPPALKRLAEQGPRSSEFSLRALHDELEAALVPLNRNASRRVLSRFAREAVLTPLDTEDVDAQLTSLLGARNQPANDAPGSTPDTGRSSSIRSSAPAGGERADHDAFDGLDLGGEESHYLEAAPRTSRDRPSDENLRSGRPSARPSLTPAAPSSARTPEGALRHARERDSLRGLRGFSGEPSERPSGAPSSSKLVIGFALMALAILGVMAALSLRQKRAQPEPTALSLEREPAPVLGGDLTVHVSAPNAQVLRFVGRAPITVERLPVGVAHEFVGTADGHGPSRVLVPANADWEVTAEGARYELALQLSPLHDGDDAKARAAAELELGPSRLDAQVGGQPSRLGSIRVVATPRGARVYQLVGFSPDVRVQDVPLSEPQELLVYREGYVPVLRVLSASDFKPEAGRRVAAVDVVLSKREPNKR